ncbi:MAG: hypothetical protein R2873_18215 [Caldilineaceae bacterium]|nr:hypothetical protein [Caldilineaceae bacterium]
MNQFSVKAYSVPMRTIWLQSQDVIDLRVTMSGRPKELKSLRMAVTALLNPNNNQLMGLLVADNKTLRLGRWLRTQWDEVPIEEGEPVPSGVVTYDEAAQFAYFSIWPNFTGVDPDRVERRRAEVSVDENGELRRIRLAVTVRRADGLAVAAGYLPTR